MARLMATGKMESSEMDFDVAEELATTSRLCFQGVPERDDDEEHQLYNPRGGKRSHRMGGGDRYASFKQLPMSAAEWTADFIRFGHEIDRPYTEMRKQAPVAASVPHPVTNEPMHVYQTNAESLDAMLSRRYRHLHYCRILGLAISIDAADIFEQETDSIAKIGRAHV